MLAAGQAFIAGAPQPSASRGQSRSAAVHLVPRAASAGGHGQLRLGWHHGVAAALLVRPAVVRGARARRARRAAVRCRASRLPPSAAPATPPRPASAGQGRRNTAWEPRQYQEDVTRFFFENAPAAAQRHRALRIQMACGTGKTYVYGMIIVQDLRKHPHGRHVIFVPWRDLARQTASIIKKFGLSVSVVGDGVSRIQEDTNVVVCVYNSAQKLHGMTFRIKIVDEAHHICRHSEGDRWMAIRNVQAGLAAEFSATFPCQDSLDYKYELEHAIKDGYISDFTVTVAFLSPGDRMRQLVHMVTTHCHAWAPMLLVFNRSAHARECTAELVRRGVTAQFVHGKTGFLVREATKEAVRNGNLQVVCVVGVFNEGTSIDELRTVIFAERRMSAVNTQQVAFRVTRKHTEKPMGNVVVPITYDVEEDDAMLARIVSSLCNSSDLWARRLKNRGTEWLHTIVVGEEMRRTGQGLRAASDAVENAELLGTLVIDRLGRSLSGSSPFNFYLERLKQWMATHKELPAQWTDTPDVEERTLGRWLGAMARRIRAGRLPSDDRLQLLREVDPMVADWLDKHLQSKGAARAQFKNDEDYAVRLWDWVDTHGELPSQPFSSTEEAVLREFLDRVREGVGSGKLGEKLLDLLREIPLVAEALQLWERLSARPRSWDACKDALARWVDVHGGRLPNPLSKDAREQKLSSWLQIQLSSLSEGRLSLARLAELRQIPGLSGALLSKRKELGKSGSLMACCSRFQQWTAAHGGREPSPQAQDPEEKSFGWWLQSLVRRCRRGEFSDEEVASLRSVPSIADKLPPEEECAVLRMSLGDRCRTLMRWVEEHDGDLPRADAESRHERSLSLWFKSLRSRLRREALTEKDVADIEEVQGMMELLMLMGKQGRGHVAWAVRCKELHEFVSQHKTLPRRNADDVAEATLGRWIQNTTAQRPLPAHRIIKLQQIPGLERLLQGT